MRTLCLATGLVLALNVGAYADFEGGYAPENWTFTADDDGSKTLDATTMFVVGTDSVTHDSESEYYITVPADGTLTFDWAYGTDNAVGYDWCYCKVGGTKIILGGAPAREACRSVRWPGRPSRSAWSRRTATGAPATSP